MKRFLMALLLSSVSLFAVGSVQQTTTQLGTTNTWVTAFTWTGDSSNGTVPTTPAVLPPGCSCQGYLFTQVETVPGTTNPTAGYAVAILDAGGADILGGAAGSLSATTPQAFAAATSATPLQGTFRLSISGQSVASAKGTVYVYFSKPGTINLATINSGGAVSASANWLTIANPPFVDARRYNWTPQSPGGSIAPGASSVTLVPCPSGVSALSATLGALVRISGGTGTAEAPAITSYAATTSGCTIGFTAGNSHSGAFVVGPASGGIQEAGIIANATGALVVAPAGTYAIYGPVYFGTASGGFAGSSSGGTVLTVQFTAGDVLIAANASTDFTFRDFMIYSSTPRTSGGTLRFTMSAGHVENVRIGANGSAGEYDGIKMTSPGATLFVRDSTIFANHSGINAASVGVWFSNVRILSDETITPIAGSAAVILTGCNPGSIVGVVHDAGLYQYGMHWVSSGDIQMSDSYLDNYTDHVPIESSNIRLSNSKFICNGGTACYGIQYSPLAAGGNGGGSSFKGLHLSFTRSGNVGGLIIDMSGGGPATGDITIADNQIYASGTEPGGPSNGFPVWLTGGVSHPLSRVLISNNKIGIGVDAIVSQYGIVIDNDQINNGLTVSGNQIIATTPWSDAETGGRTNTIINHNVGIDNITGTITVATGTVTFPVNPNSTFTDSTAIGGVAAVNLYPGRQGTFINTNGAPGAWTAGATIGNSCTIAQNKLYSWWFDGTKAWVNGPGC